MRVYEALHPKATIEEGLNHPNQYFQARCAQLHVFLHGEAECCEQGYARDGLSRL
jgi:hypothetical protein